LTVIGELLAGAGLKLALQGVVGGVRAFVKQDNLGRLLVLLHADFGKRTDLGRDVFYSWRADPDLQASLRAVLGRLPITDAAVTALARQIEPRLVRTPDDGRAQSIPNRRLPFAAVPPAA
jgi:hypothetical protein